MEELTGCFTVFRSLSELAKMGRVAALCIALLSLQILLEVGSVRAGEAKPSWQVEWEKTVEAAKKEGQVNATLSGTWREILDAGVFQKRYPEIKVVTMVGRGSGDIIPRMLAERRAGKYLLDVYSSGGSAHTVLYPAKVLDPIKPTLILPEVVDESKWYGGRHQYMDPEGQYIFNYVATPYFGSISYNTNLVNPKEFKSFWDFLNPKWKGKITATDTRRDGPGNGQMKFFYHNPQLGPKFLYRLFGEMDITFMGHFRQGVDWLATGKFAICFFCGGIDIAQRQGLPVDEFGMMKEGAALSVQNGSLVLMNRAPHANAAKVFINWLLSREGQITVQRAMAKAGTFPADSRRIDILKDAIPPDKRRVEGVEYLELDIPGRIDPEPFRAVLVEALAEAEKRKRGR